MLVWHLNQTSTGTVGEFRFSNGNDIKVGFNASKNPSFTDGQIGNGQELSYNYR